MSNTAAGDRPGRNSLQVPRQGQLGDLHRNRWGKPAWAWPEPSQEYTAEASTTELLSTVQAAEHVDVQEPEATAEECEVSVEALGAVIQNEANAADEDTKRRESFLRRLGRRISEAATPDHEARPRIDSIWGG